MFELPQSKTPRNQGGHGFCGPAETGPPFPRRHRNKIGSTTQWTWNFQNRCFGASEVVKMCTGKIIFKHIQHTCSPVSCTEKPWCIFLAHLRSCSPSNIFSVSRLRRSQVVLSALACWWHSKTAGIWRSSWSNLAPSTSDLHVWLDHVQHF